MVGQVRVGTCSWTDRTMIKAWYPPGVKTAEGRLRFYAAHFDTVEVDSTFYGLPTPANARLWAQRTPPDFTFHIKAFGMLTRHGVKPEQLPPGIREEYDLDLDDRGRVLRPSAGLRTEVFALFSEALEPLRAEGKLGLILMQFPPYFVAEQKNRDYILQAAQLLAPDRVAIEFRHSSWTDPEEWERTLALLDDNDLTYVCVDEPRINGPTVLPPLAAATSDLAYVRFHGRNAATWNARVSSAAERFRYFYSADELQEWIEPVEHLREDARTTFLMFNNCYGDYAPRNAQQMLSLVAGDPPIAE